MHPRFDLHSRFFVPLVLSAALAACSADGVSDALRQPAPISTLEFLNKNFPVLKAAPQITPAEVHVGENVKITVERPAAAKEVKVYQAVGFTAGNSVVMGESNGAFEIIPGTLATVKEDTYAPMIHVSTMTAEEEAAQGKLDEAGQTSAFRQSVTYTYDPAKSKTHYTVTASCTGGEFNQHPCGFGYSGTTEDAYKNELAAGIVSDLPLATFKVAGSGAAFAAAITGVSAVDANNIKIYFDITNGGSVDVASVKVGLWANRSSAPLENEPTSNWMDYPLAAGETVHLSWTMPLTWTSGQPYTPYVYVDLDNQFIETDETNNIAYFDWSAP